MARPSKIWYWKARSAWFVKIDGKRHNLGPDKAAAEKQFHKLKAQDALAPADISVAAMLDAFLVWTQANRAEETFKWYHKHIQAFIDSLSNQSLPASAIKPHHVTEWVKPSWSASYQRGAMVAVSRAFNWAVGQGYLESSPLKRLEKPAAERREEWPTVPEYQAMLAAATEPFKSFMEFIYETGCRPQEARAIEPRHCVNGRVEFPVKESKGKKYARTIYLNDRAKKILEANKGQFTNRSGKPWTAYSINCRMRRIAKKTGKHYPMYSIRHLTATRWLEAGMDHLTVAKLLGHQDAAMVSRVYGRVGEKSNFLEEQLRRVG